MASSGASGNGGSGGGRGFRRRELLVYGGGVTAIAALTQLESSSKVLQQLLRGSGGPTLTATLLRAEDFASLRFDFYNLGLVGSGEEARLVRTVRTAPGYVVVNLGPQAIGEQTFWEATKADKTSNPDNPDDPTTPKPADLNKEQPPPLPVQARLAGSSRLAFEVPEEIEAVPFNDETLLAWERWVARVVPSALPPFGGIPDDRPELRAPNADETAIEFPWRLILSPSFRAGWAHTTKPIKHAGRTELWHTRLGLRVNPAEGAPYVDEANADQRTVRAVWATGFKKSPAPDPSKLGPEGIRMPLTPRDRWELVNLTSDFSAPSRYLPQPVNVDRLMLTSLGTWMNSRGDWNPEKRNDLNILHWTERGTMGREHYVKVVKRGFLFPLGHRAALIQISERKIQPINEPGDQQDGDFAAFLRKRAFILIKEPERGYNKRDFPFKRVRIRTIVTPDLDVYDGPQAGDTKVKKKGGGIYGEAAFWPRVGGEDFLFNIVATDVGDQPIEFSAPLIFVLNSTGTNGNDTKDICTRYEANGLVDKLAPGRRNRPLQGQRLAYAPFEKPGDTALETDTLMLGCEAPVPAGGSEPKFRPRMIQAGVRLSAVEAVKGPLATTTVEPHPVYVSNGIDSAQNKSQSFLRTKSANGTALDYGDGATGDRCGGIGAPNMSITGISRILGPTGGDPKEAVQDFNPASFLEGAKFLGIDFAEVLDTVTDVGNPDNLAKLPKTVNETIYEDGDPAKLPQEVVTRLEWEPVLKPDDAGIFEPNGPGGTASMLLRALYRTPLNPPGEPDFEINGDLRSFQLRLFGTGHEFLILDFNRFTIESRKGQKPRVDVDISDVTFAGPLQFVNQLKELMKTTDNGLSVEIAPDQVDASYTVPFPNATAAVFTLKNISFTGGVTIPFTGDPVTARFAFSKREQPFLLSYTIFGGGGFFEIAVGAHGIEGFEAALEFGASAEIDLGVASGGVEIMAGVYFAMADDDAELTGYVRLHGELDVMGVICVSLSFYLGMTYDFGTDELWGQCTVTVEIDVLLFSGSVEVTAEKRFAGGGGPSTKTLKSGSRKRGGGGEGDPVPIQFEELLTEGEWQSQYVQAFAAEAFA